MLKLLHLKSLTTSWKHILFIPLVILWQPECKKKKVIIWIIPQDRRVSWQAHQHISRRRHGLERKLDSDSHFQSSCFQIWEDEKNGKIWRGSLSSLGDVYVGTLETLRADPKPLALPRHRERERSESKRRQLKAEERTVAIVIIICFLMSRLDGGCQCKSPHGARPASSPGRKTFHLSNYGEG